MKDDSFADVHTVLVTLHPPPTWLDSTTKDSSVTLPTNDTFGEMRVLFRNK